VQGVPDLDLLRPGLLAGVGVAVAGRGALSPYARAVAERCAALGASGERDVLVWDGAGAFASASGVDAVLARRRARSPSSRPSSPRARGTTARGACSTLVDSRYPAQGTSTESSVGESRATTYSAGSVLERFCRMWVSRGGT